MRVEHEYRLQGVCAYIAAWHVRRGRLFGDVVARISITRRDLNRLLARSPTPGHSSLPEAAWEYVHRTAEPVCQHWSQFP